MPFRARRRYTVPTAQDARKSGMWAMVLMGAFKGNAATVLVGKDAIETANKARNMAAPLLAEAPFGGKGTFGGELELAFAPLPAVVA
ncbi:hypothetical protein [Deinococcus hopiensis]|uniref:hypothetical protein n=1 Tax=Deinococcus hopiensis TaxID=309885 RepID=UPI00111C67E8|nr:hypothetical protein [Deinococcus hopiensis]